jgi:arylformamidase
MILRRGVYEQSYKLKMKIYDITKMINTSLALWPGDQSYSRHESTYQLNDMTGHSSWMTASLHTGTHVDAHYHYSADGLTIDHHDLSRYIGRCQVIDVTHAKGDHIEVCDIRVPITAARVLFKTSNHTDATKWSDDFKGLSVALIHWLSEKNVGVIGIDTPSVDIFGIEDLKSHKAFYACDLYNIEGLILNDVPEGYYNLIALPLKIEGADGSMVRAVLYTE